MTETRTLILELRLDALADSLREIEHVLEQVEERRSDLRRMLAVVRDLTDGSKNESLAKLDTRSNSAKAALLDRDYTYVEQKLDEIQGLAQSLSATLGDLQDVATRMEQRFFVVDELSATWKDQLGKLAAEERDRVQEIRTKLQQAAGGDGTETQRLLGEAWREFGREESIRQRREACEEYVDLLGGLALRDAGFDREMCRLADSLIRDFGRMDDHTWGSLTVPAREQALDATLGRIIRFGYPEWSVWSLPSVMHEFGHIVIGWHDATGAPPAAGNGPGPAPPPGDPQLLANTRADAFATFMMGPSFACSAILLRFDLSPETLAQFTGRAEVILATLQVMDDRNPELETFGELITVLRTAWNEALTGSGQGALAIPDELSAEAVQLVADMSQWLGWGRAFSGKEWPRVRDLKDRLLELGEAAGQAGPATPVVEGLGATYELRHILNAAWLWRLEAGPSDLRAATSATKRLCDYVVQRASGPAEGSSRSTAPTLDAGSGDRTAGSRGFR